GAHPGHDAQGIIDGGDWNDCPLGEGVRLHAGLSEAPGVDQDASVRLAQVAAFTGEAQHEMNNFATYVLANLGALLDEDWAVPPSREDQHEMLREAHEGARGMVDIIRRLRVAVHAEAAPRLGGVDLAELVRAEARGLGGPVSVTGPKAMTVQADAPRLARAVSLLMSAARTHGDGDAVTVDLEVERGTAVVRIAGGGPGFDRVAGRGLFASFLKVEGRAAPAADSLSIVTAIASEHGGSASVREHADGRRWFVMDLPLDGGVPL
ncbi:MAG: HAMP domain-containing sensor histidine kinase, partial [Myxococcota bacterium]|nr:HAMP domain-containing sensor histidine kinase [Myxococcota bacterium]